MKTFLLLIIIFSFASIAQTFNNTELNRSDSALVAFYPFNGNAIDESGNANNPTFIGSGVTLITDRFGNANKAYYFDGNTDSYIRIPADNFPTTDRTISFWFNADQMENHPTPLSYGGDVCNNSVLMTFNKGGYPNAYTILSHCGSNFISAPYLEAPINNWYYFTLTISGATQKIFINGELQHTENTFSTPTFVAGKSAILGALLFTDGNTVYVDPTAGYFQGKLDDFRFYNIAMSDLEVQNLYNNEANGLVAFYPFNGNAIDETGNGYNGIVSGSTLTTDRFNLADKAYNFIYNGFSSDRIQVDGTSNLNFSAGGFSLSAWIKFSGTAGAGINYPIISKHICGEQSGYILMLYNDKLTFWLAGSGGYNILTTTENYSDNSWHHVVAVYDDVNQYIYVDGVLKNSGPFVYNVYNSADLALGGYNGCNGGFNGKVDEVKIYNRPLSAAEVLDDYNLTKNSLIAYLPFNGNTIDVSGNGHDGIIYGNTSLVPDRFNFPDRAYTFPDQTSNISLTNSINLNLETGFTINAWIIYKSGRQRLIVDKHICGTPNGFAFHIDWDGQIAIYLANSGWSIVRTNDTFIEDNWYMVTASYDAGTGIAKVYVDGELGGSGSVTYNNFSTYPISIGETYQNNCIPGNMDSAIDEVKIYNRSLSDAEILEEYNSSNTDLIAYYPFNGNANDESGNNINPSYIGSGVTLTSDRFGLNNRAFYFDGNAGSYIRFPADSLPTINRTISLWMNVYDLSTGRVPFSYGGSGACNTSSFLMAVNNQGNSSFWSAGHCAQSVISHVYSVPPINTWKHWVITIEGSTQKLYIDGELKATENNYSGSAFVEGRSAIIGGLIYIDGNTIYVDPSAGYFKGKIDDIRIYDHAITDQQVIELYNDSTTYTPPTLEDGLALLLPFNGNADDESGNANNGTVSGASLTQDRFGVNGNAYRFDGADDYITIADNPNLFSDELTISWWYKLSEVPGAAWVVIGWVDGGHRYQQFFSGGQLSYLNGYNVAQPGTYFNPIYGLNDLNVWKHVVVTYQKTGSSTSTTSIYVDGELKQTDNHTLAMDYVPGIDLFIGKNHNGNFFKGYFDDLRIFNRNLSASEILALYQDSTTYYPPLEDGLVAYWPFDGNADDSTSNNNDGINYNGVFSKDRYGNDNTSMFFIAVDSYVEGINPGNSLPVGNSPRTFSAWIRNNQYNQYGSNIFHYGTQQASPTNFHFLITDVLGLGNGYGYGVVYGSSNLIDSTWHFVTGVYEGGTERITKLYVDGKIDNTGTISTEPNTILGTNWRVGRFMDGSTNFNGNIDELKVYDIPLTDQQVWDRYKATTTAPTLLYPGNDSTLINPTMIGLVLDWDSTLTATGYRFLLANDSLFNTVIHDTLVNTSSFDFYDWFSVNIDNLYWKVRTITNGGVGPWSLTNRFNIMLTDVEDETQLPTEFALLQNYPNPFNPSTTITYHLPNTSKVELKVYDVLGNEVATLVNEEKLAGMYNVQFTMNNLSSGIYFYNLQAGSFSETKKLILLK